MEDPNKASWATKSLKSLAKSKLKTASAKFTLQSRILSSSNKTTLDLSRKLLQSSDVFRLKAHTVKKPKLTWTRSTICSASLRIVTKTYKRPSYMPRRKKNR